MTRKCFRKNNHLCHFYCGSSCPRKFLSAQPAHTEFSPHRSTDFRLHGPHLRKLLCCYEKLSQHTCSLCTVALQVRPRLCLSWTTLFTLFKATRHFFFSASNHITWKSSLNFPRTCTSWKVTLSLFECTLFWIEWPELSASKAWNEKVTTYEKYFCSA